MGMNSSNWNPDADALIGLPVDACISAGGASPVVLANITGVPAQPASDKTAIAVAAVVQWRVAFIT
jgi:hypothetical protein